MGIRTPDLLIANETLYQLSYTPTFRGRIISASRRSRQAVSADHLRQSSGLTSVPPVDLCESVQSVARSHLMCNLWLYFNPKVSCLMPPSLTSSNLLDRVLFQVQSKRVREFWHSGLRVQF